MDVQSAESELTKTPKLRWLAREKESGRIYDWAAIGSAIVLVGMLVLSYAVLSREAAPGSMLSPPPIPTPGFPADRRRFDGAQGKT